MAIVIARAISEMKKIEEARSKMVSHGVCAERKIAKT
jgi:hypothetical protein